jgi:hypothetical protein
VEAVSIRKLIIKVLQYSAPWQIIEQCKEHVCWLSLSRHLKIIITNSYIHSFERHKSEKYFFLSEKKTCMSSQNAPIFLKLSYLFKPFLLFNQAHAVD